VLRAAPLGGEQVTFKEPKEAPCGWDRACPGVETERQEAHFLCVKSVQGFGIHVKDWVSEQTDKWPKS
jgi:hypothetical protein